MIYVLDANLREKSEPISVLFYPNEYSMTKTNTFVTKKGKGSSFTQFQSEGDETLKMDLFFDSYEEGKDVREYTDEITKLQKINSELHAPPILRFVWGKANFTCVLTNVTKRFTMFNIGGVPVRATLNVTFQEYRINESKLRENPKQSSDKTKIYTVREGDSLWSISTTSYGNPAEWRPIADANKIENPRLIHPGMILKIPPLDR